MPITGVETAHVGIINNFIDAALDGKALLADGKEGINGLHLANAMYLSAWTDDVVSLPIDENLYFEKLQEKIKGSSYKKTVKAQSFDLEGTY